MTVDDRSDEERLADELLAELEEEFDDLVVEEDPVEEEVSAPVEEVAKELTLEEKKAKNEARGDAVIQVSEEARKKAMEAAKLAQGKGGDVKEALTALEAKSETSYTRHPIVSVLGHVDHGKTSILDRIRGTKVFDREAGAITQHIGASEVPMDTIMARAGALLGAKRFGVPGILCIDTPGHHAFTTLRSRGGQLADIAVLVVDINEGFKPQTVEAINILRRSKTPFVVAANKIDRTHGWVSVDAPFLVNVKKQKADVVAKFDEKFWNLVAAFYDQGLPADRYDRIADFKKTIAIVPTCARTGEGIPDLLAMLVGLSQKFLETRLETDEEKPGEGTVLEVKEDKGLGQTLDVVLYAGAIRSGDRILLGTRTGIPVETTIRALLKPAPLDEMRDARKAFVDMDEIVAAAGIKLVAPGVEDVVSGAPLRVLRGFNDDEAYEAVSKASKVNITLDDEGVLVKADTIGSLEALVGELKAMKIPVRTAEVGDISRRDVVLASAMTKELYRVVLGFNVKLLPEVEREAHDRDLPVFSDKVIYSLVEDYQAWLDKKKAELDNVQRQERQHPAKFLFLSGCSFRQSNPAVFGVRVLAGSLRPGRQIIRASDSQPIGRIKSIQKDGVTVTSAKQGDEVALSVPGPTLGRQVKEEDMLYLDMPGSDAKFLYLGGTLKTDEQECLIELMKIKRKTDRFWGM